MIDPVDPVRHGWRSPCRVVLPLGLVLWLATPAATRCADVVADETLAGRIARFCGDCHALPRPESYRAADWHGRVRLAYEFHARSGRIDLDPPPITAVTRWYVDRAPARLPAPALPVSSDDMTVRFEARPVAVPPGSPAPGTADVRWVTLADGPRLVLADMLRGEIAAFDPCASDRPATLLATLRHPCRVEPLPDDGGLLVAELGSTDGFDHARGRAVHLTPSAGGGGWRATDLVAGLGRIAAVRFRGAGAGVVVAEFGYQRTGSLLLVPFPAADDAEPAPRRLDERSGAVDTVDADLDGDGRNDLVALFGQEHETVAAYLDRGNGRFERHTLWRGEDLALGSSSIDRADVDGDGDDDLLLTHGDAFDNRLVTPWHGVTWLEKRDGLAFVPRRIADLPGAYRVRAADLDGDGDTDLVVSTWLPADVDRGTMPAGPLPSLVWFEGRGGGRFIPHVLESDRHAHPALEVADFDADGDPDLAVATHGAGAGADGTRLTLWWNRRGQ